MASDPGHRDAGAYVLGALDATQTERFEAHLAGCDACAATVERFLPVVAALDTVATPPAVRRRHPAILVAAAAAVALVVAGLSFLAGTWWAAPSPVPTAAADRTVETTDEASGVHVRLDIASAQWGTRIDLVISGVQGPERCELVAIGPSTKDSVVASWIVPETGYGVAGQTGPLRISGSTAVPLTALSRFEIRAVRAAGPLTLVSLPVS
jgi:hypothetical protein